MPVNLVDAALAPNPPDLTFIFVVDGRSLEAKGLLLAATLAQVYGKRRDVAMTAYVPEPYFDKLTPLAKDIFARAGVELRALVVSGKHWKKPYPHGNKILAAAADRQTRMTVFLDTDMLCLGEVPQLFTLDADVVGLVPEGTPTWGKEKGLWELAYAHFGLPLPDARVTLMRRRKIQFYPYFNAGLVAFRQDELRDGKHFGQLWLETASDFDFKAPVGNKRPWLDQITLPLCMARHGFRYQVLPEACNYSISNEVFERGDKALLPKAEPLILHYHRSRFLAASPYNSVGLAALRALARADEAEALVSLCLEAGIDEEAALRNILHAEG